MQYRRFKNIYWKYEAVLHYLITNSKNKEIYIVKNGFHEMFNDVERDEYINKIFTWISKNRDAGKTDRRMIY